MSTATSLAANAPLRALASIWRAWQGLRPLHFAYAALIGVLLGTTNNIVFQLVFQRPLMSDQWGVNFNAYGGSILHVIALMLAILVADRAAASMRRPWVAYVIAVGAAVVAGVIAVALLDGLFGIPNNLLLLPTGDREAIAGVMFVLTNFSLFTGLIAFVYVHHRTALRNAAALHAVQLRSAEVARQTLESRLQVMQARVDPQFLFKTLAQVERLHERDAAKASRMLDDLIVFLRAALPPIQETASTLAKEFNLVHAYLAIVCAARRRQLSFGTSLPEALRETRIPPMVLLPLTEHVVGSAFDASDDAGHVDIAAANDGTLRISVIARGAVSVPAETPALDRVRERLTALYGAAASLVVGQTQPRNVEASVSIPHAYAVRTDR